MADTSVYLLRFIFLFTWDCILPRHVLSQTTGEVRLVNGGQSSRGRVEFFIGGEWTTVCDDDWDDLDAAVVCRQLGYESSGARARHASTYGQGTGTIGLDNVECEGDEAQLRFCSSSRDPPNCEHTEDAGVDCVPRDGDIRLVRGLSNSEGRVEVYYNNQWGTICDNRWDEADAEVVCRQVGAPTNNPLALNNAFFGGGSGPIYLDNVRCSGHEEELALCLFNGWGIGYCDHQEDAGVRCNAEPSSHQSQATVRVLGAMGAIMFILIIIIVVFIKCKCKLRASRRRDSRDGESNGNINTSRTRSRDRQNSQNFREDCSDEYSLRVNLNDDGHNLSPVSPITNPIHVTNISLNLNFDERQHVRYLPPIDVPMPPPYSPSGVVGPGSTLGSPAVTDQSPPPYSVSDSTIISQTHQNAVPIQPSLSTRQRNLLDQTEGEDTVSCVTERAVESEPLTRSISGTAPSAHDEPDNAELAIHRQNYVESSSSPQSHAPHHNVREPLSRAPRRTSAAQVEPSFIDTDVIRPISEPSMEQSSPQRRDSMISNPQSPGNTTNNVIAEPPPPYSPWSMSTFV